MKEALHHFRFPISILLIGWVAKILGAMRKLEHAPEGDVLIQAGMAIQVAGIIYAIFVLLKLKTTK